MKMELNHLPYMVTITSKSPEDTFFLGERWAEELKAGWVIGLDGDLGAGKTQLVKGLAKGLNIKETITSPTFTLVSEYEGSHKLDHLDFYRLENNKQIYDCGLEPYLSPEGIAVIEWFCRWTGPKPTYFRQATITHTNENERQICYDDFSP